MSFFLPQNFRHARAAKCSYAFRQNENDLLQLLDIKISFRFTLFVQIISNYRLKGS